MKKEILQNIMIDRRSTRKFTEEKVKEEDIKYILECAMSGPSACFRKPWKFYIVTNDEVIEKLRHVSRFSNMNASCAIIVCGDLEKALPKEMASFWIQDCSAAMENLLLAAEGCGLGACWIGVYPQKRVVERMKDILDITNDKIIPLGMVWIGYKAEEKKATCYYDDACVHYIK